VRIAELSGGRRFLSDDLALLESVALILVRRLDAVRVVKERYARSLREQEMSKLATEAELRALRAQLNPHFLFNALTTIGYLIRTEPERAVETLLKLTGVLRAVLRAPDGGMVRLGEEIDLIESYLAVERARFEERLRVRIDVPPALLRLRIPALLLQPLVENAIKHGITPSLRGGELQIVARLEADNGRWTENGADWLRLEVNDTGVGVDPKPGSAGTETSGGVGLENVRRRLRGIYGDQAALSFSSRVGVGTSVTIRMPMPREVVTV
jgi:LytS/YehU family sensor histidine kinase